MEHRVASYYAFDPWPSSNGLPRRSLTATARTSTRRQRRRHRRTGRRTPASPGDGLLGGAPRKSGPPGARLLGPFVCTLGRIGISRVYSRKVLARGLRRTTRMSVSHILLSVVACLGVVTGCTASATVSPPAPGSTCAPDSTVVGCSSPSTGYSCTGSDTPADSDATLECSVGEAGNAGSTVYCCLSGTFSSSSCAPDSTVAGCQGGSFGFSCLASDSPDDTDSTLVCSTGVAGNAGATLYCCTD